MWADNYISKLLKGETVSFRPRGNSMVPKIHSGELVTVTPIDDPSNLTVGDIVLCKVAGSQYLHLISAIKPGQFQISNNHGRVNGWCSSTNVYGKVIKVVK